MQLEGASGKGIQKVLLRSRQEVSGLGEEEDVGSAIVY